MQHQSMKRAGQTGPAMTQEDFVVLKKRVWALLQKKGDHFFQEKSGNLKRICPDALHRTLTPLLAAGPALGCKEVHMTANEIHHGIWMMARVDGREKAVEIPGSFQGHTTITNCLKILQEMEWLTFWKQGHSTEFAVTMIIESIEVEFLEYKIPEPGSLAYDLLPPPPPVRPRPRKRRKKGEAEVPSSGTISNSRKRIRAKTNQPVQEGLKMLTKLAEPAEPVYEPETVVEQQPVHLEPEKPVEVIEVIEVAEPVKQEEPVDDRHIHEMLDRLRELTDGIRSDMIERFLSVGSRGCQYSDEELGRCLRIENELTEFQRYIELIRSPGMKETFLEDDNA